MWAASFTTKKLQVSCALAFLLSSVKAAMQVRSCHALQGLDKGGSPQRQLLLLSYFPDVPKALSHHPAPISHTDAALYAAPFIAIHQSLTMWSGMVKQPCESKPMSSWGAVCLSSQLVNTELCFPECTRHMEVETIITVWEIDQEEADIYLSSRLLTSSSSHRKFCRFCTHSKKLTVTPPAQMQRS